MRVLLPLKKKENEHDDGQFYDDSDEEQFYASSSDEYNNLEEEEDEREQQLRYVDESTVGAIDGSKGSRSPSKAYKEESGFVEESSTPVLAETPAAAVANVSSHESSSPQQPPNKVEASTEISTKTQERSSEKPPAVPTAAAAAVQKEKEETKATLPKEPSSIGTGSTALLLEHDNSSKPAGLPKQEQISKPPKVPSVASAAAASSSSPSTLPTALLSTTCSTRTVHNRKRRSPSPPLDCKPASTKSSRLSTEQSSPLNSRDCKPPALDTSELEERKMAGGRRLLNREDSAELDVRYAYFPTENDPASARGDRSSSSSSLTTLRVSNHAATAAVATDDNDDLREQPAAPVAAAAAAQKSTDADNYDDAFAQALKKNGLEIVEQDGDGNCLFRAISLQVYGDASMHEEVRQRCLDYMVRSVD